MNEDQNYKKLRCHPVPNKVLIIPTYYKGLEVFRNSFESLGYKNLDLIKVINPFFFVYLGLVSLDYAIENHDDSVDWSRILLRAFPFLHKSFSCLLCDVHLNLFGYAAHLFFRHSNNEKFNNNCYSNDNFTNNNDIQRFLTLIKNEEKLHLKNIINNK